MNTGLRNEIRRQKTIIAAALALMATLALPIRSMGGVSCSVVPSQVIIEARIVEMAGGESKWNKVIGITMQCPKPGDVRGMPASVQANVTLTLDASIASDPVVGALEGNSGPLVISGRPIITDAILTVNGNIAGGVFATPNYMTTTVPIGGGSMTVPGQSSQYGNLVGDKTLRWDGVRFPLPGVEGNPNLTTFGISNIRAILSRRDEPVKATIQIVGTPLVNVANNTIDIGLDISPWLQQDPQRQRSLQFLDRILTDRRYLEIDAAGVGTPTPSPVPMQSQIQAPYGSSSQNPYGYPIYQNPYGYGGAGPYGGAEDRGYNNPWGAPGPWGPGIPWEIPPMIK
jgi:hypothetical protein